MSNAASPPAGFVVVPKDEFFAKLAADGRDIMPRNQNRLFTTWETTSRVMWGWSFPGWANPGSAPQVWAVKEKA